MVKIEIYRLFDKTVCAIEATVDPRPDQGERHAEWSALSYVTGPPLAHSESDMLQELILAGLDQAEEQAAARGGWSLLA